LDPVENVARAFYEAQDDACSWDGERPVIKDMFLAFARKAIAYLDANPRVPILSQAVVAELSKEGSGSKDTFVPPEYVH
jgi:hypothetical protein